VLDLPTAEVRLRHRAVQASPEAPPDQQEERINPMTGIWKDASRFKSTAKAIRDIQLNNLPEKEHLEAIAQCCKAIDLQARENELEALITDLEDAEAPEAAAGFLRRVRRNIESKIAAMQRERGEGQPEVE
jgi:hypothetical protein